MKLTLFDNCRRTSQKNFHENSDYSKLKKVAACRAARHALRTGPEVNS